MCSLKQFIVDPTIVEAYAAWKMLEFNKDLSMLNIILEENELEIVNALRMEGQS